ncbi:MAG TPA: hypothetical protein QF468_01535, partial [Nitrospinota bacterium]|nr:hypothetical protein [Nitrospinota bacterium]
MFYEILINEEFVFIGIVWKRKRAKGFIYGFYFVRNDFTVLFKPQIRNRGDIIRRMINRTEESTECDLSLPRTNKICYLNRFFRHDNRVSSTPYNWDIKYIMNFMSNSGSCL